MQNRLTCQWCGLSGQPEDFELDEQHGDGFWCPDCDGHTFYDDAKNQRRRILLLLENNQGAEDPVPTSHLPKRLSPLRYPGGKSKLIDFLAAQFRDDQLDTFVEPFAGGASVGLAMLSGGKTKHLVLNDTDYGIYAFWKTVCENPKSLIRRIEESLPTHADLRSAKEALSTPTYWGTEDLAWAQLLANRLSFNGIVKANPLGGKQGSQEALLARWNPKDLAKRIETIHAMADRITVSQVDAMDLIESSAYWDGKSTIFIDPPYVKMGKALYQNWFEEKDHWYLSWMLRSLYTGTPGADIIMTYDDCDLIREMYPFAEQRTIGRAYSC